MKILNPTDQELNEAFATGIAGWTRKEEGDATCWYNAAGNFMGGRNDEEDFSGIPKFTQSADLVLPWLEKTIMWTTQGIASAGVQYITQVTIENGTIPRPKVEGRDNSFAKSAVIALLRANGIEVEFSHAN